MRTPEGKIKDKVKALLTEHDAYQFWPVPTGYGKRTLDCLVCHYGRFLAIETKRAGKDLTAFQKITRASMTKACGSVFRVTNEMELAALRDALKQTADYYARQVLRAEPGYVPGKQ